MSMNKEFRINKFTDGANLYRRWVIKPPLEEQVIDCSQEEFEMYGVKKKTLYKEPSIYYEIKEVEYEVDQGKTELFMVCKYRHYNNHDYSSLIICYFTDPEEAIKYCKNQLTKED